MTAGTAPVMTSMPAFETYLPFVGKIDFNQPLEWLWFGGLAADLLFVSGISKWIIAAGILAARYEFMKYQGKPQMRAGQSTERLAQ